MTAQGANLVRMANHPLHPDQYRVDESTECWIWLRAKTGNGYGVIRRQNRNWPAHRWFYEQTYGPLDADLQLDHLCRNRACVNPDHVEPVTHAENGRRGNATKLDWPKVRAIRTAAAAGELHADIARRYDIAANTVTGIVRCRRWKEAGGA